MDEFSYFANIVVSLGILVFISGGLVYAFIRVRKKRKTYAAADDLSTPIEGTDEDRAEAEADLGDWSKNLRVRLLRTHELVARLNTVHGYSRQYAEDLCAEIRKDGIAADYYFQENAPLGGIASLLEPQGDFEIFVERDRVAEGMKIIDRFRGR